MTDYDKHTRQERRRIFNDGAHSLVQREYVIVPIVSTSKLRRGVPFGGGEADIEDFGHGDPLVNNKHVYYE